MQSNHVDLITVFFALPGINVLLLPDAPVFTIVALSSDLVQLSERKAEEMIGKGMFEAFPSPPEDTRRNSEKNLLASLEYVLKYKEGHHLPMQRYDLPKEEGRFEEKYWIASNKPVLNEEKEVVYIIHTSQDVTAQVKVANREAQIKGIEKTYGLFMQTPVVLSILKGENHIIEMANEGALKLWGKSAEVIGKSLETAVPEIRGQGIIELLDIVRETGQSYSAKEEPVISYKNDRREIRYYDRLYQPYYEEGRHQAVGVFTLSHDVTEIVEARRKAEQAKEELQFVTDTMPQLVWATEPDGYSFFFNKGWLEYTGLSLEEVKGDGWIRSLHPDDLEQTFRAWRRAVEHGEQYDVEYRLRRYDGVYRWFVARGAPMRDHTGAIVKWYGTSTDIEEQKQAEQVLWQSNERFNLVAKATQDAIWDWNLINDEIWWNEGFKELFGYQDEELEPTIDSWYNRLHPEDRERVVSGIHDVIDRGGTNWSAEYRFRRKDGSYSIVFDRGYALHDQQGNTFRMLGSMQDITERYKSEEALRHAHERIIDILESTTDAFYALDADFNFTYVNKRAAQLWGRSSESLIGKHYWTEFPKAAGSQSYYKHYEALNEGKPIHYETISPLLNIWIDTSIYPGKDNSLSVFFRDITERKHAEEELERKVKERTHELEKVNQELKRSNQNLEEFAYAASHDLKEPIRKINFFADRLKERLTGKLETEDIRYFERLETGAKRMNTLIDDLLLYSHISRGALINEQVDLNQVLARVIEDLELRIAEKGALIEAGPLPLIRAHQRQMQQMFENLIGNALKYSKSDRLPEISITSQLIEGTDQRLPLHEIEVHKKYYLIEVKDNGIGFDQQDAERIFNVFTRLHGNAEYKGTGVGLSIVRKVVENHRGYVWAESTPGDGATFRVLLPAD